MVQALTDDRFGLSNRLEKSLQVMKSIWFGE